jgi:feruloyl esterase
MIQTPHSDRAVPVLAAALAALLLGGCAATGPLTGADPKAGCESLAAPIEAALIGLPSGRATVDAAVLVASAPLAVAERGPTPAALITPGVPQYCKVNGRIAPLDPKAPPILFQVNLPTQWNGRSVQYGGGGFNGMLINALGLVPAARYDAPAPLAQGYVTYGTDSGHQNAPGVPPQAFAQNEEALVNFAHASYKKVRDVAVQLMKRAYGRAPAKLYFVGSSEGGREGLTMAQRYPEDFDGIFSRVPVINWTGLQHAGTRNGIATMGQGWIRPPQVKLVHDAVLGACDAADGAKDNIVADPVGCARRFDVGALRCKAGAAPDTCLSEAQVKAVLSLHAPYRFDFPLANGVQSYPGWGLSGEDAAPMGPTGGWRAWWLGGAAPTLPPAQNNSIAWVYGSGAIQYFYAQDPDFDVRKYDPNNFTARVKAISALMDSTDPDLSRFDARGGKLIMMENLGDYAQSPYAGTAYYEAVVARLGAPAAAQFLRLYTAPGVDHVGAGAPGLVDMLGALADWVERGKAPADLTIVAQEPKAPFAVSAARPLCHWPMWPRYKGGDMALATSFECTR